MKLKDFDFRIVKPKNEQGGYNSCSNDECVCNTPFLYGDEAKYRLGEFIGNGEGGIELWSGFYDRNGKKIYEGDIVCFKNRGKYNDDRDEVLAKHIKEKSLKKTFLAQIFFKNEGGGYCIKRQTKRGHTKYFSLFDMSFYLNFRLEVVGNIHENAELLKELG